MKKKIISIIGMAAFAVAVAFNASINLSSNAQSGLTLENIEALARNEGGWGGTGKGTLYGNLSGTRFCCCPGNLDCAAAECVGCP